MADNRNQIIFAAVAVGVAVFFWTRAKRKDGPLYIEGEVSLVPGKRYEVTVQHTGSNGDAFRADLIKDLDANASLCIRPFTEPNVTTFRMTSKDARKLVLPQEILPGVATIAVQEVHGDAYECYQPVLNA